MPATASDDAVEARAQDDMTKQAARAAIVCSRTHTAHGYIPLDGLSGPYGACLFMAAGAWRYCTYFNGARFRTPLIAGSNMVVVVTGDQIWLGSTVPCFHYLKRFCRATWLVNASGDDDLAESVSPNRPGRMGALGMAD